MVYKPIVLANEKKIPRGSKRVDTVAVSREELFKIRNPQFAKREFKHSAEWKNFSRQMAGNEQWVYWPSENTAVRMLDEDSYFELRTARNRIIISHEEQAAYRRLKVGVAGLSVGSSVVSALALSGGPKTMKIADFDSLEPTNLNRIRAGILDVGSKKIDLAASGVWRIDPFADLTLYPKGLTEVNVEDFVLGNPRLDIVIDEIDNLALKVALRLVARRERIPVLMATDSGDSVLIDVERFDLDPKRKIFHGLAGSLTVGSLRNITPKGWVRLVAKIIGGPYILPRQRMALGQIGKTLDGASRLGTDGMLTGAAISLAVRKLATGGEHLKSGRYMLNMEKVLSKQIVR